jgi:apolipoprotein N-acyltransferase
MAQREVAETARLRWSRNLAAASSWPARGLALVLGVVAGLGFAPLNLVPLFALGLIGLIWLTAEAPTRRAGFLIGWWWGLGHFAMNSYWIAESFLVDAERFAWMIPFILGGLSAYLALYPALATLVLRAIPRPMSFSGIAGFATAWTAAEWLRGHLLTGYPWDLAAYIWSGSDAMMQSAAWWGSWGLSLVTVFAFGLPALFLRMERRTTWRALAGLALVIGGLYAAGAWRLSHAVGPATPGDLVRIVQPNVAQSLKISADDRPQQVDKLMRLTLETPGFDKVKAVVWPESAVNYLLEREPNLVSVLSQAAPAGGVLVTGAPRGAPASGQLSEVWNSLAVIDHDGRILATADKFHLVPLGEYVPFREIFPFINKLTPGSMNFSAGPGPRTLRVPGLPPFSPLICYEAIFPGAVTDSRDRPGVMINITNDGWFGTSTGPFQHLASARFRAVEEGIPMLRAANTGISAVVDAYGRLRASSHLMVEAVIDAPIPAALPPTPFARFGLLTLLPLLLVMSIPPLLGLRKRSIS